MVFGGFEFSIQLTLNCLKSTQHPNHLLDLGIQTRGVIGLDVNFFRRLNFAG